MDLIEAGDLDEKRRRGGCTAGDQLEVCQGSEEGGAFARVVLPAPAGFETEGGEQGGEPSEGRRRANRLDQR